MSLKWEYCECGCHCMVAEAGPLIFSIRKVEGKETLFRGHGGYDGKPFKTFDALLGALTGNPPTVGGGVPYDTLELAKKAAEEIVRGGIENMQKALGEGP